MSKQRLILGFFLIWTLIVEGLLLINFWAAPVERAIILMALGLFMVWVLLAGGLMWKFAPRLLLIINRLPFNWRIRFVFVSIILALIEEAIATFMSNLALILGDSTHQAAITASKNYLEVVAGYSVIVFIPMFIAWALLLSWRNFSPFSVMVLFGITGLLSESLSFGPQNFLNAGFWILVYGLMVYLPARSVPGQNIPQAKIWHYPIAILLPIVTATPVVMILLSLR
jgi:hypothetical protein